MESSIKNKNNKNEDYDPNYIWLQIRRLRNVSITSLIFSLCLIILIIGFIFNPKSLLVLIVFIINIVILFICGITGAIRTNEMLNFTKDYKKLIKILFIIGIFISILQLIPSIMVLYKTKK